MRLLAVVLAAAVVFGLAGVADAAKAGGKAAKTGDKPAKTGKADVVRGKVVSVAADGLSFVVQQAKTQQNVTVTVDASTRFKGVVAKAADLVAGQRVVVKLANGTAKLVTVNAAKAKGPKSGKHSASATES